MPNDPSRIAALFELPFADLIFEAQTVHRRHFDPNTVQLSTLLSIKTGGCSEDCGYCAQSARFATGVGNQGLLPLEEVLSAARAAKARGATRLCLGAAWRGPKDRDLAPVLEMIRAVRALGLETCATLGLLRDGQAERLAAAGLDYYNHNIDTSPQYYDRVVHTHALADRLATLEKARRAGIKLCCGGIMGMGESRADRIAFIAALAAMDPPPESVPINLLVRVPGTPMGDAPASREQGPHDEFHGDATVGSRARPPEEIAPDGTPKIVSSETPHAYPPVVPALDPIEFVRTIAVARIAMPASYVRLSAGRQSMPESLQALCFLAGANSIFYGERLLTTPNPLADQDRALFDKLGLKPLALSETPAADAGRRAAG